MTERHVTKTLPYLEITTIQSSTYFIYIELPSKVQYINQHLILLHIIICFPLHIHSHSKSLVFKLIPCCHSSDGSFLVISIDVSCQFFQSNLLVSLCLLHILIHCSTDFILQYLKARIENINQNLVV